MIGPPRRSRNTLSSGSRSPHIGFNASMTMRGTGTSRSSLFFGVPSTHLAPTYTRLPPTCSTPRPKSRSRAFNAAASPQRNPQNPNVSTSARRSAPRCFPLEHSSANASRRDMGRYTRRLLHLGSLGSSTFSQGLSSMSLSRTAMRQMPSMVWYGRLTDEAPALAMMSLIHAWTSARVMVPIRRSAQRSSQ